MSELSGKWRGSFELEGRGKGRGGSPNKEKMRYCWEIIDEDTL